MLAVKRVKLPASVWLNRQDKPLPRRGMFPVKICEIHSLDRYSRSIFIGAPPPIAPQKWTRGKERIMVLARLEFILLLFWRYHPLQAR